MSFVGQLEVADLAVLERRWHRVLLSVVAGRSGTSHPQVRRAVQVEHGAARELGLGRGEDRAPRRRPPPASRRGRTGSRRGVRRRARPSSSSARHLGLGEPGRDRHHRDAVRRERSRERLAERDQPGLARAVGRRIGLAAERAARGDVDDPPAAAARACAGRRTSSRWRRRRGSRRACRASRAATPRTSSSAIGWCVKTPALLTSTSSPPSAAAASSTITPHRLRVGEVGADDGMALARKRRGNLARAVRRSTP